MVESDNMSAKLIVKWDWSSATGSGKETAPQEAFKYSNRRLANAGDEESYPFDVVDTKLRVRGTGRAMVVRYESSPGKDFALIGYSVLGLERTESEARK